MTKSKKLFKRICVENLIKDVNDDDLEKKIDSNLKSGILFTIDSENPYKIDNELDIFENKSCVNHLNIRKVRRKKGISSNKTANFMGKPNKIPLNNDELDIWGISVSSNTKVGSKKTYPGEKIRTKGPSIVLPLSGESINPFECDRKDAVFQFSAFAMSNTQQNKNKVSDSIIDSFISNHYDREDVKKLTGAQKCLLFKLIQKGEFIDLNDFKQIKIDGDTEIDLGDQNFKINKNIRKKKSKNRIMMKKRNKLQKNKEITKKLNSDISNIGKLFIYHFAIFYNFVSDLIIKDINSLNRNLEYRKTYLSILRKQLESARKIGIISKFRMGKNLHLDKPKSVLLGEDFKSSCGSLRRLRILDERPTVGIMSGIYRRGLTEIPPKNDSYYGRRLSKLLRKNRKSRKVSKRRLIFSLLERFSKFQRKGHCMHRDSFKKNKPILSAVNPSNGFLVLVTNISHMKQHSKHSLNYLNNGGYLAINAKLTDANRLYKTSILTRNLSDNSNIELFFTIFCFKEWSSACSFISEGDVLEIIGAFVKFEEDLVICEYNNSRRDSSMTVWRRGFEHVPAILTNAAVICSKGNVYLPAWARIYDRVKSIENKFLTEVSNCTLNNCRIETFNKEHDICSSNGLCVFKETRIDNNVNPRIEKFNKKRRALSDIEHSQINHYRYIEKLSDIKPNISTNMYGVVLEVGNNPIKRSSMHQTHIFINVTLIDPSVVELVQIDNNTRKVLENLLSGIYKYNDRPQLNHSIPTISLEIATQGDVNTLPVISFGDIIRVHRVEPTISKQKYIDLPYNFRNTSVRLWSIYDLELDTIYTEFTNDEDIFKSEKCYFTVENTYRVGNTQQKTTFTKDDSIRLLRLQRWVYELFHEFPYFSMSPYTKSLSFLLDASRNSSSKAYGDIIVLINDICFLSEFFSESSVSFDSYGKPHIKNGTSFSGNELLCLIVTEYVYPSKVTLEDVMRLDFDNVYLVILSGNYNYGLKEYFLDNKKPLSPGDWIRIKNASLNMGKYYSYKGSDLVGPFTIIETNRSRITRLPLWSGDVKLVSSRTSPIFFKDNFNSNKSPELKSSSMYKIDMCGKIDERLADKINTRMKVSAEDPIHNE